MKKTTKKSLGKKPVKRQRTLLDKMLSSKANVLLTAVVVLVAMLIVFGVALYLTNPSQIRIGPLTFLNAKACSVGYYVDGQWIPCDFLVLTPYQDVDSSSAGGAYEPFQVTITEPQSGERFRPSDTVTITAEASYAYSPIQSMVISVDGNELAVCPNTSSCSAGSQFARGSHTVSVTATAANQETGSAQSSFRVR